MATIIFYTFSGFALLISTVFLAVVIFHPNAKAQRLQNKKNKEGV